MASEGDSQRRFNAAVNHILTYKNWDNFFFREPCVHYSFLLGGSCGTLTFAHKLKTYRGHAGHAFNAALLVTVVSTGVSFYLCNTDHDNKRAVMKKAFDKSNIPEYPQDGKPNEK